MGPARDYNEDERLNMGDALVGEVCDENRMDEDNGAAGENMRAIFIDTVNSSNMEQDFVLLNKGELNSLVWDLHYLGPRFQHFLREFELP